MSRSILVALLLVTATTSQAANPNNFVVESGCGPRLLIQVPVPERSYNGPTILEGDVFEPGVTVTVTVDGIAVPVTMSVMNPGKAQFWRWATTKVKARGPHVAFISATNKRGSTSITSNFNVAASP